MHVRSLALGPFLAAGLLAPAAAGAADEAPGPRIDLLRIQPRGADVLVQYHLEGVLNPELARKIEAGLETTIQYDIRLYRQHRWWVDRFLEARTYRVAATFDPLTREYVIEETMDGRPLRRSTTRDFAAVVRTLLNGENLLVFRLGQDGPHRNLYVSMRATFDSTYLFAFIPMDARTSWKKSPRFEIAEENRETLGRSAQAP
jgi:hypothetical protein